MSGTVFILEWISADESSHVVGVYTSRTAAKRALVMDAAKHHDLEDSYSITEWAVDEDGG